MKMNNTAMNGSNSKSHCLLKKMQYTYSVYAALGMKMC